MAVQDPNNLDINTTPKSLLRSILITLRGLYTKDSTTGNPLLAGSMGRLELVQSQSATAATVDFTTGIVAGYDYEMDIEGLVLGTDNTLVLLRVSTDGGATWKAGVADYRWVIFGAADDASSGPTVDAADGQIRLSTGAGNATGEHFDGTLHIRSSGSAALHKRIHWTAGHTNTAVAFTAGTITLRRKWRS